MGRGLLVLPLHNILLKRELKSHFESNKKYKLRLLSDTIIVNIRKRFAWYGSEDCFTIFVKACECNIAIHP